MNPTSTTPENPSTEEKKAEACSLNPTGGACWTGPRMCPGFALLGGWIIAYPVFFFTGSKPAGIAITLTVAAGLMMGLHTRLWRFLKSRKQ